MSQVTVSGDPSVVPRSGGGVQPKTQTNGHHLGLLQMLRTQRGHSRLHPCLLPSSVYINSHGYTCSAMVLFFVFFF